MQRRKKQLTVAGWLLCVLLTQGFADPVRSAAEPDYPPLSVVNSDGKADGFSVELLRAALAEMGMEVSFQTGVWSEIKTDLAEGRLDVLPLVARTPERETLFDFTPPYLTLPGTIFVRSDNTEIRSLEDLKGRRIAVMKGDAAEEYVRRARLSEVVIPTTTFTEAFQMLSDGRADAVIAQKQMGLSLLKKTGLSNIRMTGNPTEGFKQEFCFAVKKGDATLLSKLNEGLASVITKGTQRQLALKWLHPTETDAVRNRVLVFSDDSASPPTSFLDEHGQPTGFNVELLQAVARKTGLNITFKLTPWNEVWGHMKAGKIDITCILGSNPERAAWVDFSTPHSVSYRAVFARRDSPPYKTPEDLKGRRISVPEGGALHNYALQLGLGETLTAAKSPEEALELLKNEKVDFALNRLSLGLYLINKNGWNDLYAVDRRFQRNESCYAVRKGDTALLDLINDGLSQLKESGEYQQIYDRWLGVLDRKGLSLEEEDSLRKRGLVYSDNFSSPPYSFFDEQGQPAGFNVELLRAVAQKTGLNISFQLAQWETVWDQMQKGAIDITSLQYPNPKKEAWVDFSIPHSTVHRAVFARRDSPPYKTPEDLKGSRIAVPKGGALQTYALQQGLEPLTATESLEAAMDLLDKGQVDFTLGSLSPGRYWIHQNGRKNLYVVDPRLQKSEFCYAVRKGNAALLNLLNDGLTQLKESGEYQQIYNQWLGVLDRKGLSLEEEVALRKRVLVFSDDFASPPYSFLDEQGRPTGFNVELLRAVAKKARLTVSFKLVPWGEVPDKMKSGEADISCMHYPNPEREAWVDFSTAHSISYRAVFARRDSPPYKTSEDLKGRRISAQAGGVLQAYAQRLGERPPTTAETLEGALALLEKGQVDFSLCRLSPGRYWIQKNRWKNLYAVDPHLQKSEYCYVVRKGDAALLNLLDEGLQQIKESGEYRQIYGQWLGVLEQESYWPQIRKILLIVVAAITLLTTAATLIIVILRRQVKKRTLELETSNQSLKASRQAALNLMEDAVLAKERVELTQFAIDQADDSAYWADSTGLLVYVNEVACRVLGYAKKELLQLSVSDLDPDMPTERWPAYWQELQEKKSVQREMRHKTKDGRVFPVEVHASHIKYGDKEYICTFSHDITERKEAEKHLRFEQDLFRSFMDILPANVYFKDADGRFVYVSQRKAARHGMEKEALIGKTDFDFFPEDQARQKFEDEQRVMQTGQPIQIEELSGSTWHQTTKAPRYDENGNIAGTFGVSWDITERKEVEKRLRFEQNLFLSFMEALPANVYFKDTDSRFVYVNQNTATCRGMGKDELIGKTDFDLFPEAQARKKFEDEQRVMQTRKPIQMEERAGEGWHQTTKAPRYDEHGNLAGTFGISWDITERKQFAEALQNSEARYRLLFENMTSGFALHEMIYDEQGNPSDYRWLQVNPAFEKLTGLSAKKAVGHTAKEILPKIEDLWIETFGKVAKTGKSTVLENYSQDLGKYFETRVFCPAPDQFAVIFTDVTERIIARQKLEESRQFLRTIIDSIPVRVFWKDRNSIYLGCNLSFANDTGLANPEEVGGKVDFDLAATKEQSEAFRADDLAVIESGSPKLNFEEPQTRPDGTLHWLETNKIPLKNIHGEIIGVIGTYEDITERKQMQAAMQESAERYRTLFDQSNDGITLLSPDGNLLSVNESFAQMHGYGIEEMLHLHLKDLDTPETFRLFPERMRLLLSGEALTFEVEHYHKDGHVFPLEVSASLNTSGEKSFLQCLHRDITERKRLQEALQESEFTFRKLFEDSSDAILFIDETGVFVECNRAALDLLKMTRAQFLFCPPVDISPEFQPNGRKSEESAQEMMELAYKKGLHRFDWTCVNAEGEEFIVEVSLMPIVVKGKTVLYTTWRDITERKRLQAALQESSELFRLFMQHSPVYTYIKTVTPTESRVLQASDNFEQMIGIPGSEMAGKTMTELFPEELALKITADDWTVVNKGEVLRTNEELNGRSYETTKFPIVQGDRTLLAGYTTDITEEKKNRAELLRLSTAIEQSPEHIIITSPDGNIQYVNPAFETVTGYSREEVLGKNPRILQSGNHDKPFYSNLWKTITTGKTWDGRFVNKRKNGQLYTETAVISAVRDPSGTITGYVAVKRDITQELVQEEKFRQSQKMDAIGQLTGGIAHDFNNVLQAILGFSELLISQLKTDSLERQNAFEIQKAAKRAAEMVRQLLTFSRSQSANRKRLDLNTTVRDIEVMLHLMLGKAKFTFVENPALHEIYADPGQITQLLTNLTVNARDAMPNGGRMTIKTENITFTPQAAAGIPDAEPGSFVCLSASDTGCGMSREVKDHLFEPFFTTKAVGLGTGMGLSVVYGIVRQNKGWIHVDSEEGQGTTLKIYLPACETPVTNNPTDGPRNERILLVEDDEGMSKLVIQMLESAGYKPIAAASAEEALELFKQKKDSIDMLFSDIRLPGKNGIELADILREEKPNLPVLLYSGYEDPREKWIHLKSKGYHFLKKPFTVDGLLTAVCGALAEAIR